MWILWFLQKVIQRQRITNIRSKHVRRMTDKYLSCAQSAVSKPCEVWPIYPSFHSELHLSKLGNQVDKNNHRSLSVALKDCCYQSYRCAHIITYFHQSFPMWFLPVISALSDRSISVVPMLPPCVATEVSRLESQSFDGTMGKILRKTMNGHYKLGQLQKLVKNYSS